MSLPDRLRRVLPRLEEAALRGEEHEALRLRIAAALRPAVGYDVACVATLDPVTAMFTHCALDGCERDHAFEAALFEAEYRTEDVAPMPEVARRARPVAVLTAETGGDPSRSARFRNAFSPAGFGDELRLVLADAGVTWGSVQLLRGRGSTFRAAEAEALAAVARPLARLLRLSLLRTASSRPAEVEGDPPGVLLVGEEGTVEDASPEALRLLEGPLPGAAPQAVLAVAARARAGRPARVTTAAGGGWLAFHGTVVGGRVAVLVERARPLQIAEVVASALALTPRERAVLAEVTRGRATKEIARRLKVTEWTVQDHLKSLFGKTGTSTRQELVAALFFGHWAPRHEAGSTPSPYGHYLRG